MEMAEKLKQIFVGKNKLAHTKQEISGEFVDLDRHTYYKISNYDQMPPFFMTLLSHSDHWCFISSLGSLSAGRKNPNQALFPYYTVDKIHDAADHTGSKTVIMIHTDTKSILWEPFSDQYAGAYQMQRNLYKNDLGNQLIFEEINLDLKITFRYQWKLSEQFGFVKKSEVINHSDEKLEIEVVDGVQNIMPYGVDRQLQQTYSNLTDAYKKNEKVAGSSIGLFMLSAIIVDRAEPSEALKTNLVWSIGLNNAKYLLSANQIDAFTKGEELKDEKDIRGTRGAYFVNATIHLQPNESKHWSIIADINQDAGQVAKLKSRLLSNELSYELVEEDIAASSRLLRELLAKSDAIQLTEDHLSCNRHLSNVQFNVMRGGLPEANFEFDKSDVVYTWKRTNSQIFLDHQDFINELPDSINQSTLRTLVTETNDAQLLRLYYEYLPFSFSRRHGDPSRPWNMFSIDVKKADGTRNLSYEGNWRDIFQNWEALCLSFPEYAISIITKFVNATTADGYNPYRITKEGIDWEVLEPDNPWSNIGYWGDHQLIYLLRLLELSFDHHPDETLELLTSSHFCYANVPYRIKTYDQILVNPVDTIVFDHNLEGEIQNKVNEIGSDGKLICAPDGQVHLVNFTEKILVTLLTKVSNLVPEGGIWLNTQRPEWNDANNALVGNGVSMVTMYQLRQFVVFASKLFRAAQHDEVVIADEVFEFYQALKNVLEANTSILSGKVSDERRKTVVDGLGQAGSNYRQKIYDRGFSKKQQPLTFSSLNEFLDCLLNYVDHSIEANKRSDQLYHSYNLIQIGAITIGIKPLSEMLEGQVNILSSGKLSPKNTVQLLDQLKKSALYRSDQNSYILYPNKDLARFEEKNIIPEAAVKSSVLLTRMLADGQSDLVYQDVNGNYHFNGNFRNSGDLEEALISLRKERYSELVESESSQLKDLFESVFDHESFTGRSGTFFGYEGLGSIYWHMVSKLVLAVNECYFRAIEEGADEVTLGKLVEHYYEIRAGIGLNKTPEEYGAFPTDPYSHTPANGGAKQPGMTGQVKEDILARFGELGVAIANGSITFNGSLLRQSEFLTKTSDFVYYDLSNTQQTIKVAAGSLAFTYGQTPIIYTNSEDNTIHVTLKSGEVLKMPGHQLNTTWSQSIFQRKFEIYKIEVFLKARLA